jgi:LacI family transcriptional regulator
MAVTIKDIADKIHVSYATVSRALNNKYGVDPKTREKVLAAAKALNYTPNTIARGLVQNKTFTLGLMVPDITNPFFPEVAVGIEDRAKNDGYHIILCNSKNSKRRETDLITLLTNKRVDGIIFAPISHQKLIAREKLFRNIPFVYVSKAPKNTNQGFVVINDILGGYIATQHLIERGYKRIGFIGSSGEIASNDDRYQGFLSALSEYSIPFDQRFTLFGEIKQQSGYSMTKKLLSMHEPPRAIFAETDLIALGAMQAIKEQGLHVPGDLAVIGFDDIPFASFPEVQLTTISQPKYRIGQLAAEILLEMLDKSNNTNTKKQIVLEPKLIIRGTT